MKTRSAVLSAALLCAVAGAQTAPPPGNPPPPTENPAAMFEAFSKVPDTAGSGPYPAIKAEDPAFPGHTVYRPRDIAALKGRKLPVLLWGNGGCSNDGASARLFLSEIASHGYLVVAAGTIRSGPGIPYRPEPQVAPPPGKVIPQIKTQAQEVAQGLDLAIRAGRDRRHPLYGHVDAARVAVSGHSCGGLQALQVAGDPRIRTVIVQNSGIFADGTNPIAGMTVDKSLLKTLHTPILYILGGPQDVAHPNGTDDFARIDTVPAVLVDLPVGHGGTFMQPNGGRAAQITLAWLDWQLGGDRRAAAMFTGADCGLCRQEGVRIERKRLG
ncbi:hypothetical protein GCM10011380_11260 [Sphingomonas metalli]|uniref:Alpha/beta hydrolase n=1 Tax=Sphingomonas metalli TaxID=1779358 RepID=A0A916WQL3_9SPHN|nr:hypothetical protein [Sphingomonas metalli]GGB23295.1 hypothetical protein GCM10011380_11260 [Sphingomonas metalli]